MWALVQSGQVVAIYNKPKPITINGIQHPSNIFRVWSKAQLKSIGIYDYREINSKPNNDFYWLGSSNTTVDDVDGVVTNTYTNVEKALDDVAEVDENGQPILDSDGNQIITMGLKSIAKTKVKTAAAGLLQNSDWQVIRAAEGAKTINGVVASYRSAVRAKSDGMEAAIDAVTTVDGLEQLYENTLDNNSVLNDWPKVPGILK
jgi:hypothetical protein